MDSCRNEDGAQLLEEYLQELSIILRRYGHEQADVIQGTVASKTPRELIQWSAGGDMFGGAGSVFDVSLGAGVREVAESSQELEGDRIRFNDLLLKVAELAVQLGGGKRSSAAQAAEILRTWQTKGHSS